MAVDKNIQPPLWREIYALIEQVLDKIKVEITGTIYAHITDLANHQALPNQNSTKKFFIKLKIPYDKIKIEEFKAKIRATQPVGEKEYLISYKWLTAEKVWLLQSDVPEKLKQIATWAVNNLSAEIVEQGQN